MKTREAFTFSVRGGRHFSQIVSEFSLDMTNEGNEGFVFVTLTYCHVIFVLPYVHKNLRSQIK